MVLPTIEDRSTLGVSTRPGSNSSAGNGARNGCSAAKSWPMVRILSLIRRLSSCASQARDRTRLRLNIIRDELIRIVAQRAVDDPNLHYIDGRSLFGEADVVELPLPDQLHPDPPGHRRIGERFADAAVGADGPFAV
ncbi:hypothetical protein ACQCSU_13710 [Pseudarthrobacter sp. O4]|uniref:hypothetical protein n=1 Tax=Pseudarthrobacter sp. O4 TaxID=3418417 RepID=UPI003CE9785C